MRTGYWLCKFAQRQAARNGSCKVWLAADPLCTIPPLSQEELKKRFWEERQGMFGVRRFCRKINLRQWGYLMLSWHRVESSCNALDAQVTSRELFPGK